MRWLLLGSLTGMLAATGALAEPRERIPLDRVQDVPPQRIDLIAPVPSVDGVSSQRMEAMPDDPGGQGQPLATRLRPLVGVLAPVALVRATVPVTRRTHGEIRKGEKSGQLSRQEARRLRAANNRAALSAWAAGVDGRYTDYEARDVQGHAEAVSAYVFEKRFAPKIPDVTYPKNAGRGR